MKFLKLELKGYIGIYNGLNLSSISLDFTKCKYNKIIIKGSNGSGKSTIDKALNPLPDSNSSFVPGMVASKLAVIQDGDIVYRIKYTHGLKPNGERDVARGYIKRIIGDIVVDLNPTGNISKCRDAIFNEFNLDSNFVELSQLGGENRGLADKKPAERKKYVSAILSSVDSYNKIYKTLSKKSSIFKATINQLISKIDSIGDESKLKSTLISLENRINQYQVQRETIISEIAKYNADISYKDPNGLIQNEYNELINSQSNIIKEIDLMKSQIDILLKDLNISLEESKEMNKIISSSKISLETSIKMINDEIETLLINREEESKQLQQKVQKLSALTNDYNYNDIQNTLQSLNNQKLQYDKLFKEIGIDDVTILTKDEYVIGLNTLKDIKDTVDVFRDSTDYGIIEEAVKSYEFKDLLVSTINTHRDKLDFINNRINDTKSEIIRLETQCESIKALQLRPGKCKIDDCPFINDSLNIMKTKPLEKLEQEQITLQEFISSKKDLEKLLDKDTRILEGVNYINILIRNINNYKNILFKLPNGYIFSDESVFLQKLINGDQFNEINILYSYLDKANMIEEYKSILDNLYRISIENKLYESKNDIIEEIQSSISELTDKTNDITNKMINKQQQLSDNKQSLLDLSIKENKFNTLNNLLETFAKLNDSNVGIKDRFNKIKNDMISINDSINTINSLQNKLRDIDLSLQPLNDDKDKLKHAVSLLYEYNAELADFQSKYDKVETVKQYSSPSKGIQNVFMEIYMNKIIDMSNSLLQLLFDGEFVLQPFVITADEFRIPCRGEGLPNDDISSMSTAQICMISMILSFTLLYQSSTKYNIIHLDEIDGGLDTENRLTFTYLLEELMMMLQCEQCIIVSHNNELNTEQADIIVLKQPNDMEYISGNIIYKYSQE